VAGAPDQWVEEFAEQHGHQHGSAMSRALEEALNGIPLFVGIFLDGYCSTVQGLLDWFEVDLGFTEL